MTCRYCGEPMLVRLGETIRIVYTTVDGYFRVKGYAHVVCCDPKDTFDTVIAELRAVLNSGGKHL